MSKVRTNPVTALKSLRVELSEVLKKLDTNIEAESLENTDIDKVIEYLNATIRKLDHTVEHLLENKS